MALHAHTGERHDTFPVTLTYAEVHLLNRVREDVAARFLSEAAACAKALLPACHKRLEALDVLCDQLGLEDGSDRLRARAVGARDPAGPDYVSRYIGEASRVSSPTETPAPAISGASDGEAAATLGVTPLQSLAPALITTQRR
jgi:hypothetical protein